MTAPNPCGDCDLCCRLPSIPALKKPPGEPCSHHQAGGCAIYAGRPDECRGFECRWLKAERLPEAMRMGPEWRPDRAGFYMYGDASGRRLNLVVDPARPEAYRREPYRTTLAALLQRADEGLEVRVHAGGDPADQSALRTV